MAGIEGCVMYDAEQGCPLHGELCAPREAPAIDWERCEHGVTYGRRCAECDAGAAERERDYIREREARIEAALERGNRWRVEVHGDGPVAEALRRQLAQAEPDALDWIVGSRIRRQLALERPGRDGDGWIVGAESAALLMAVSAADTRIALTETAGPADAAGRAP